MNWSARHHRSRLAGRAGAAAALLLAISMSSVTWLAGAAAAGHESFAPVPRLGRLFVQQPTPTPLPPVDPTPDGGPIAVGTPLAAPALSPGAIQPASVSALIQSERLASPSGENETVIGFTRDGRRLVTHAGYRSVHVRAMPDGQVQLDLPDVLRGAYGPIGISPDGQVLATTNQTVEGRIDLWSLHSGALLRRHHGGRQVRDLRFGAHGQRLVAARLEGTVNVWDVADGTLLADYGRRGWGEAVLAVHPALALVATGQDQGARVDIRDLDTGEIVAALSSTLHEAQIARLLYRPDGGALAAVLSYGFNASNKTVWVWHDDGGTARMSFPSDRYTYATAWSPDGRWLAIATQHGANDAQQADVWLWDAMNSPRQLLAQGNRAIRGLSWNPSSSVLAVGIANQYPVEATYPGETVLFDAPTGRELRRLPGVVDPVISPDGAQLVVTGDGVADRDLRLLAVDRDALTTVHLPRLVR